MIRYFKTWKRILVDYEFIEWNEDNFSVNLCNYSREAYLTGNYAHVSDVCRIYALYKYGGIYLDTDVEILKSFEPFRSLASFIGLEATTVSTAVIGATPGSMWLYRFLQYYMHTHFINVWGHTVRIPNTVILGKKILLELSITEYPTIFPTDYFCGVEYDNGEMGYNDNTVAIHHFTGSWLRKKNLRQKFMSIADGLEVRYLKPLAMQYSRIASKSMCESKLLM